MGETFELKLLSPYKQEFSGPVEALMVPGEMGYLGILPRHTKLATTLVTGELRVVADGQTAHYAISGGFCEVRADVVTVLADSVEHEHSIDVERARASRDRARQALEQRGKLDPEQVRRLEAKLARAQNRLTIAGER